MTDETGAAASPSVGGAETALASTPVETAAAGLETLAADKAWQADFNGDNGRPAQLAAVKLKADTTRAAFNPGPDAAPTLPENIASGLNAPDAVSQAAAEAMTPATDASEFKFGWSDAQTASVEDLQQRNTVAAESAFAAGANPHYAKATIDYIDQQLANPNLVPMSGNEFDDAMAQKFGEQTDATILAARETLMKPLFPR